MYEQLMEHNYKAKSITWEQITNFFMNNLLETDNIYFCKNVSKSTVDKVTDERYPQIKEMVNKLKMDLPTLQTIDYNEIKLFSLSQQIDKILHK